MKEQPRALRLVFKREGHPVSDLITAAATFNGQCVLSMSVESYDFFPTVVFAERVDIMI